MSGKDSNLIISAFLSIVFTIALTFITVEAPRIIGFAIVRASLFPDYNPVIEFERIEEFMLYMRPIGYACLATVGVLVAVGFKTGRRRISSLGSIAFFMPTFGYYVAGMFFLTGLGLLRILWMPFWDVSPNFMVFKLGDIIYVPYGVLVYLFAFIGVDIRSLLSYLAIFLGLFVFSFGTVTWLYGKSLGREMIDFWIYRYSRHPQYLGFIIWSYGVMLLATLSPFPRGGYNVGPSLPWLISTMAILCVALTEEIHMTESYGKRYLKYQSHVPFMFPLVNIISSSASSPIRLVVKRNLPESGKEIIYTFILYTTILISLSFPFLLLNWPPGYGWSAWPYNVWPW